MLLLLGCPRKDREEIVVQIACLAIELLDVVHLRLVSRVGQDDRVVESLGGLMKMEGGIVVAASIKSILKISWV